MAISAAAPTKIKGTSITAPSASGDNHSLVLGQLKETTEIAQRLRGDPNDSFVKVSEINSALGTRMVNNTLQPPIPSASSGSGGTVNVLDSITGDGSSGTPLKLSGDSASPGNTMVYGTNGSGVKGWYAAGGGSLTSPLTTKGDLWGWDTTNNRIPVGSNGQVLTADSTQTLGVKWAPSSGGGTTLFNITPDLHPALPTGVGLGPNDEFEIGSSIDTTGARYSGATAWTAFNIGTGTNSIDSSGALFFTPQPTVSVSYTGYTQPFNAAINCSYLLKIAAGKMTANQLVGLMLATASGTAGHIYLFGCSANTVTVQRATNSTTFSSNAANYTTPAPPPVIPANTSTASLGWVYYRLDWVAASATFTVSTSFTGTPGSFSIMYSESAATFLGTPALIGFGMDNQTSANATASVDFFRRIA